MANPLPKQPYQPLFPTEPEHPNFPDVSGTSFPLLATVLAGFSVSIVVQLILQPAGSTQFGTVVTVAVVALLISSLLFLSSIVFAINAQANNYLPFLQMEMEARNLLNIGNLEAWTRRIERRWQAYHQATLLTFYSGTILLLTGINLIVWAFVGGLVAAVFLLGILGSIVLVYIVSYRALSAGDRGSSDEANVRSNNEESANLELE